MISCEKVNHKVQLLDVLHNSLRSVVGSPEVLSVLGLHSWNGLPTLMSGTQVGVQEGKFVQGSGDDLPTLCIGYCGIFNINQLISAERMPV